MSIKDSTQWESQCKGSTSNVLFSGENITCDVYHNWGYTAAYIHIISLFYEKVTSYTFNYTLYSSHCQ